MGPPAVGRPSPPAVPALASCWAGIRLPALASVEPLGRGRGLCPVFRRGQPLGFLGLKNGSPMSDGRSHLSEWLLFQPGPPYSVNRNRREKVDRKSKFYSDPH